MTTEITIFKEYELVFAQNKISDILSDEFFSKFETAIKQFGNEVFPETEDGRKRARQLSRSLASNIKIAIFEKNFDALIKQKEAENQVALDEIKSLKKAKVKFVSVCDLMQKEITKVDDNFKKLVNAQIEKMKSHIGQYETIQGLKIAKQSVIDDYEAFDWCENKKEATDLLGKILDRLISQEGVIASLEAQRAENARIQAERDHERLVRERENHERIIREQIERGLQGKEIELPPIPTPAPIAKSTPQEQSYSIQAPVKIENNFTIAFDLETTGLSGKTNSIVQIAALVFDGDFKEIDRLNILVKQEKPMSDDEMVTKIHGKTYKMCQDNGVDIIQALSKIKSMIDGCKTVVGHNIIKFDIPFLIDFANKNQFPFEISKDIKVMDTYLLYKNIAKCPLTEKQVYAGYTGYKNPTLTEAYNFVFGKNFKDAHDALGDVSATADIYKNLVLTNRKVKDIFYSMGFSEDQVQLALRYFISDNLINYRQIDIFATIVKTL